MGGLCYHVINRGNARAEIFHCPTDYTAFGQLLGEAVERMGMRILAYCLMPNHVNRGTRFGTVRWQRRTADRLGLKASLNPRGRPRMMKKR